MSQSIPTWCWYCKQEIPAVADMCPYCGKPLNDATKVVRCRRCGKFLLKNTPNCTQCGEPTPQPEAPTAPSEPSAEAAAPPAEPLAPGAEADTPAGAAGDAEAAAGSPETMRMFEELELLSARKAQSAAAKNASKGKNRFTVIAAVLAVVVGVGVFLGVSSTRTKGPSGVAYCKDGEHRWIEADCTTPKTCAVCGKTEGEAEGHRFVENVCAVCGEYERKFYFIGIESERSGGEVIFRGSVKNFTDAEVQSLQIKLQLYDENKTLVETLPGTTIENAGLAPFESTTWQVRYGDSAVQWKYWRVYVADYAPKA